MLANHDKAGNVSHLAHRKDLPENPSNNKHPERLTFAARMSHLIILGSGPY